MSGRKKEYSEQNKGKQNRLSYPFGFCKLCFVNYDSWTKNDVVLNIYRGSILGKTSILELAKWQH